MMHVFRRLLFIASAMQRPSCQRVGGQVQQSSSCQVHQRIGGQVQQRSGGQVHHGVMHAFRRVLFLASVMQRPSYQRLGGQVHLNRETCVHRNTIWAPSEIRQCSQSTMALRKPHWCRRCPLARAAFDQVHVHVKREESVFASGLIPLARRGSLSGVLCGGGGGIELL